MTFAVAVMVVAVDGCGRREAEEEDKFCKVAAVPGVVALDGEVMNVVAMVAAFVGHLSC